LVDDPEPRAVRLEACDFGGDLTGDRRHPTKRYRPIAAGIVPVGLARAAALVLAATAVGAGGLLCG